MNRIDDAPIKARLVEYLERIGAVRKRGNERESFYLCPIHEEKTGSFHVTFKSDGDVFKCMGCDAGGTVLDLHAARCGLRLPGDYPAVVEGVAAVLGARVEVSPSNPPPRRIEKPAPPAKRAELPNGATSGTLSDWRALAVLRKVSVAAVETATRLGTLLFAHEYHHYCWLITDESRRCMDVRRLDGKLFGKDKALCVKGATKNAIVGLHIKEFQGCAELGHPVRANDFRAYLAVEGGGDYLAGFHFSMTPIPGILNSGCADYLPIGFLGAQCNPILTDEDKAMLRGKRVRFYPHCDQSGSGLNAVSKWARLLADAGATVDAFSFEGLRKQNGQPVNDLNDCTDIHAEDAPKLYDLLP